MKQPKFHVTPTIDQEQKRVEIYGITLWIGTENFPLMSFVSLKRMKSDFTKKIQAEK